MRQQAGTCGVTGLWSKEAPTGPFRAQIRVLLTDGSEVGGDGSTGSRPNVQRVLRRKSAADESRSWSRPDEWSAKRVAVSSTVYRQTVGVRTGPEVYLRAGLHWTKARDELHLRTDRLWHVGADGDVSRRRAVRTAFAARGPWSGRASMVWLLRDLGRPSRSQTSVRLEAELRICRAGGGQRNRGHVGDLGGLRTAVGRAPRPRHSYSYSWLLDQVALG